MTTIKAACHDCGDVILGVADLEVHECIAGAMAWYSFLCPACGVPVARPASPTVVEALDLAGCRIVRWGWPAELAEAHGGPPITSGDLTDFTNALLAHSDSSAMLAELSSPAPEERQP